MKALKDIVYENGVMPVLFAEEGCTEKVINAIEQTDVPVVEILQRGDIAKTVLKEACKIKKNAYVGAGTVCSLEQCKEMAENLELTLLFLPDTIRKWLSGVLKTT